MLAKSARVTLGRRSILPSSPLVYGLASSWANRRCHRAGRRCHPWCSPLFEFSCLGDKRRKFFRVSMLPNFFHQSLIEL